MLCPACLTPVSKHTHVCTTCGHSVGTICSHCHGSVGVESNYCPDCGTRQFRVAGESGEVPQERSVESSSTVDPAERRQLTILFCDLVDSTGMSEKLPLEVYSGVVQKLHEDCQRVEKEFGGYLMQWLGDGAMIYFGYPRAREDDPHRAVRAGLYLNEASADLAASLRSVHGVDLALRVGIHTGLVVSNAIFGPASERFALGGAPNVAARLKDVAKPGDVVVSGATYQLIEGPFDTLDLGVHELKGVGRGTQVYKVLREVAGRRRMDIFRPGQLSPLVGRDAERAGLRELWSEVKAGSSGHAVFLGGEPGIGKTRLVRDLQETVAEDPSAWMITCQTSSMFENSAFHPIVDLLERVILRFESDDVLEDRKQKLRDWLDEHRQVHAAAMPLFIRLFGWPADPRYPAPAASDGNTEKGETMRVLLDILFSRAAQQPVLFVLEDLHWADPSSRELVDLLVDRVATTRVLFVATHRPDYVPNFEESPTNRKWVLDRLDRVASASIVRAAINGKSLPAPLLEQMLDRTDGNPLYIEELSKAVVQSGQLRVAGDRLETTGALPVVEIPSSLRDSLMARLDRLSAVKVIAQIGAVLGREFSYELLLAVSPVDEKVLRHALQILEDAGLLNRLGVPPAARYEFRHGLIQEAAYDAMLTLTRQEHHRVVAGALIQRFPDVDSRQPELIAHHFLQAGMGADSLPYWQRAGQQARERAANQEAIAHLELALRLLGEQTPAGRDREEAELEMLKGILPAYMAIKGWASAEVERTTHRAAELSALLGNFEGAFGALWGLWTNYFLRGRMDQALETGKKVLDLAKRDAPPDQQAMYLIMAYHAVGYSHFYRGEFPETLEQTASGLALFDLEVERTIATRYQFSSSTALRMMHGSSLWMLGQVDQVPAFVTSAVQLTREIPHFPSEAFSLAASLLPHYYRMDVDAAGAASDLLLELAERWNFEIWSPFAHIFRGWVLAERGDVEEGIAETRSGLAAWQATKNYLNQTIIMAMLGRMLWRAGRPAEALATLDSEIEASRGRAELQFAPELHRLRGEILVELGRTAEGETALFVALELARSQQARSLELRAGTSLVRLWHAQRRQGDVDDVLGNVYATFNEGFDTADLVAAREALSLTEVVAPAA